MDLTRVVDGSGSGWYRRFGPEGMEGFYGAALLTLRPLEVFRISSLLTFTILFLTVLFSLSRHASSWLRRSD